MKKINLTIAFLAFFVLVSGCTFNTQKITIQKRVSNTNIYEDYKEVTQNKQVKTAIEIVENADWENKGLEIINFPDYKFQFPFKYDEVTKIASYSLWINLNGKNLEIVTDSDKYVRLGKQDSTELFEVLVGETLEKLYVII